MPTMFKPFSMLQIANLIRGPAYAPPIIPPAGWLYEGFLVPTQDTDYFDPEYTVLGPGGWWEVPVKSGTGLFKVVSAAAPPSYDQLPTINGWRPAYNEFPNWDTDLPYVTWTEEIKYRPYGVTLRYYARKVHYWHKEV